MLADHATRAGLPTGRPRRRQPPRSRRRRGARI